jgi:hypothetical protein
LADAYWCVRPGEGAAVCCCKVSAADLAMGATVLRDRNALPADVDVERSSLGCCTHLKAMPLAVVSCIHQLNRDAGQNITCNERASTGAGGGGVRKVPEATGFSSAASMAW